MKSESIEELASALSKAQGSFIHAKKDTKNEFFRSQYADLASVIDAAKKPLSENGLAVTQIVDTDSDGLMYLETMLMHSSGEWISGRYPIRPVKTDPQAVGSAITYARRYAFSALTGIAADDDDGNAASQADKKPSKASTKLAQPEINVDEYKKQLESAQTMQQLISTWQVIPKSLHRQLEQVKNDMKNKLSELEKAAA